MIEESADTVWVVRVLKKQSKSDEKYERATQYYADNVHSALEVVEEKFFSLSDTTFTHKYTAGFSIDEDTEEYPKTRVTVSEEPIYTQV
jgi:hypothetical protein